MKNILSVLFLLMFCITLSAQESKDDNIGTIKVQKSGHIVKVLFDNVNYRLVGIDQYGNPLDSAVTEFEMGVSIKGVYYKEQTVGPALSYKMQQMLGKCDQKTKIIFDKIKTKDRSGTITDMPKFSYNFGSANDYSN